MRQRTDRHMFKFGGLMRVMPNYFGSAKQHIRRITDQNWLPIAATFISMAAAFFSWQQLEVSRDHNRRSLRPVLQLTPWAEGEGGKNGLYLTNEGGGPAFLTNIEVHAGQHVFAGLGRDEWAAALNAISVNNKCFGGGWPQPATALRAGFDRELLRLKRSVGDPACFTEMVKLAGGPGLKIAIEYESIYGEKFWLHASSNANNPQLAEAFAAFPTIR